MALNQKNLQPALLDPAERRLVPVLLDVFYQCISARMHDALHCGRPLFSYSEIFPNVQECAGLQERFRGGEGRGQGGRCKTQFDYQSLKECKAARSIFACCWIREKTRGKRVSESAP